MVCEMQFIKEKLKYKIDYSYTNVKNQTKPTDKLVLDHRGNLGSIWLIFKGDTQKEVLINNMIYNYQSLIHYSFHYLNIVCK